MLLLFGQCMFIYVILKKDSSEKQKAFGAVAMLLFYVIYCFVEQHMGVLDLIMIFTYSLSAVFYVKNLWDDWRVRSD